MSRTRHSRKPRRPDRAVVERFRPQQIETLVTKERAALPCGCCIFVGINIENGEAGTGAQACSEQHAMVTEMANELLVRSLANPSKKLLVDVCADLLSQAARATL